LHLCQEGNLQQKSNTKQVTAAAASMITGRLSAITASAIHLLKAAMMMGSDQPKLDMDYKNQSPLHR
jgi:hypothetical protein